jgi:fructosamine-3-kinase
MSDLLGAAEDDGPSLVHGDLWNGNVHFTGSGAAVIDPACYYGHREVDLAMAALFGGFPEVFFEAYQAEWPLQEGAARRRPIYQLYYLLVHVVLFGGSYASSTATTLRAVLR